MINRYVNLGLLILFSVVSSVLLVNLNYIHNSQLYSLLFDESVAYLMPGSSVVMQGVKVGQVKSISIHPTNPIKVLVVINTINLGNPSEFEAEMLLANFMGQGFINLQRTPDSHPQLPTLSGHMQIRVKPSIMKKITDLADKLITRVEGEDFVGTCNTTFQDIMQMVHKLNSNVTTMTRSVQTIINNVEALTQDARTLGHQVLVDNKIHSILRDTDSTLNELRQFLQVGTKFISHSDHVLSDLSKNPLRYLMHGQQPTPKPTPKPSPRLIIASGRK